MTLVVHCLSRTPSTKKSQLNSNYSALTLKFGALEPGQHMTTLNRNQFSIPPSHNSSEINQIKGAQNNDDVGNFASRADDLSPFMMDRACHPYQSVVKFEMPYEPINFSCSLQTTTTSISRDNSLKCANPKKGSGKSFVADAQNSRRTSFAEKLKKCTQKVLIFKSDASSSTPITEGTVKIKKKASMESIGSGNTISNSSLKEIDEEEFTSSELAQIMFEVNNEIRHLSTHTS